MEEAAGKRGASANSSPPDKLAGVSDLPGNPSTSGGPTKSAAADDTAGGKTKEDFQSDNDAVFVKADPGRSANVGSAPSLREVITLVKEAPNDRLGNVRQFLIAANVALSYIIIGASIAWSAPLLYEGRMTGSLAGQALTQWEGGVIGSSMFLATAVMPLPCSFLSQWIGPKVGLIIAGMFSSVSWLLIVFVVNVHMLYMSRILAGLMAGAVMTIVPMYISEISRPKIRGMLGSLHPLMLQFGTTFTFILGPHVELQTMAIICGIMPHLFLILMFYAPESPYWLLRNKYPQKAQKNFEWLRGRKLDQDENLKKEFEQILRSVEEGRAAPRNEFIRLCKTRANRKALVIVEMLTFLQRLTGVTAIVAYAAVTLPDRMVGILRPPDCLTVMGVTWTLSLVVGIVLIDRVGRIPLLVMSAAGCFIANSTVGAWFYVSKSINIETPARMANPWFPFVAYLTYGSFYCLGLASIPGVLQGEMFAIGYRELASAVTVIVMALTSCIVNSLFIVINIYAGVHVNFLLYSIASLCVIIFTLGFVPETKSKPLYEIQRELNEEK